jgi:hypothetical protein
MAGPETPKRTKHAFIGLFGFSGIGKTRLIGEYDDTLIIRPPIEHTDSVRTRTFKEWVVRSWSEMDEVLEYLQHKGKDHSFVWLDSISAFQDTGLDDIWADVIAAKPHRKQYGVDKGEYGVNMTRLGQWVRAVVGLDAFNFGWTAHPFLGNILNDEGSHDEILLPWVQGKNMPLKMCGYMNMVAYYQIKKQKEKSVRVLRTNLTEHYFAKDQFDAFPNGRMVNPTMPKIMAAIEAARPKPAAKKRTPARRRTRRTTATR